MVMINATDAPQFTLVFRAYEIMAPALLAADRGQEEPEPWAGYTGYYTADVSWSEAEVVAWEGSLAVMWIPTPDPVGSLVELLYGAIAYDGEVFDHAGGYVGAKLAALLRALLNTPGALIVSATAVAVTVILTTRGSFVRTVELAGNAFGVALGRLRAQWAGWRSRRTPRPPAWKA